MTKSFRLLILLTSVTALPGCGTTILSVQPVTPVKVENDLATGGDQPGIRYALPMPFLLMTPSTNGDGSFTVEVIYLPDESRTYAIDSRTKRGKYELTAELEKGLLKKLLWKQEDAAVAAETVRASGEVAKTRLQQDVDEKKARETKQEEAKKAAESRVAGLDNTFFEKKLALSLAEATRDAAVKAAEDEKDPAKKKELIATREQAELAVKKAKIERDAAQGRLDEARRAVRALGSVANIAGGSSPSNTNPALTSYFGPVLYRIIDDGKGPVRLDAVRWGETEEALKQRQFPTATAPKEQPKPEPPPALKEKGEQAKTFGGAQTLQFSVTLTAEIQEVVHDELAIFTREGATLNKTDFPFNVQLEPDRKTLTIALQKRFANGGYQLEIPFKWKNGQSSVNVPLRIE